VSGRREGRSKAAHEGVEECDGKPQIFIDGYLALEDQEGRLTSFSSLQVAAFLVPGDNLMVLKPCDSYG
jgi:hypothetical protein